MPPRILVLHNDPVLPEDHPDAGSEHDVVETARTTARVLEAAGFEVAQLGISFDPQPLLDELKHHRPDAVFNLFEGLATQTNTEVSVAALLEWLGISFTGSPSAALCLGRDKVRTKHLLAADGLPTPDYAVIESAPAPRWRRAWPAIVKPAYQDASVGIDQGSVVTTQSQLEERARHVLKTYGPPVLVERFVFGREFHVNCIEGEDGQITVLPLAEIGFEHTDPAQWPIYSFAAKWDMASEEYKATPLHSPVEMPHDDMERLRMIANRAFRLLQCRDYARLDVRMTEDRRFHILEINPNPISTASRLSMASKRSADRTNSSLSMSLSPPSAAAASFPLKA